jgi:hypothetical protein
MSKDYFFTRSHPNIPTHCPIFNSYLLQYFIFIFIKICNHLNNLFIEF